MGVACMETSAAQPTLNLDRLVQYSQQLFERRNWSRTRLLAYQRSSLETALRHAVAASPFYQETLGGLVARGAPLDDFPILTKRILMDNFDRIITDRRLSRRAIEHHLDGPSPDMLLLDQYRAVATGGTTGERGVFVFDDDAWLATISNTVRFQKIIGIDQTTRAASVFAPSAIHLSYRISAEMRALRQAAPKLNVLMPIDVIVAALNDYQPEALSTYPSFVRVLAREQRSGRLHIAPRLIRTGAETLTAEVRDQAADVWGIPVINSYACTEAGSMGQECGHADGMHLAEDLFIFEVTDADGRSVPDGVKGSKLLVTSLTNRTLPLVRYELSDIVTKAVEPCPCGLPFWRIASIDGRREEVLRFPRRGGGTVDVHAIRLRSPS